MNLKIINLLFLIFFIGLNSKQTCVQLRYFYDLTYDTVTLSVDGFPLNVGYIASYAKMKFNERVEIRLFKKKTQEALETSIPDVIGFANYAWNRQISKEMFKIFLEKNPNGVVIRAKFSSRCRITRIIF